MRARKFIRNEEGAAVVEFALVMPILALIIFGIIDFGRAFYTVPEGRRPEIRRYRTLAR